MMVIPAEPATNTLIGVGISVAGNLLISIALNLQKLAHLRLENRPPISPSHPKRASESTPLIDHHPQDSRDLESDSATQPSDRSSSSSSHSQSYQPNDLAYLSSPLWWMGFILMSTGELGNFVSYGFAPASVVAPLGTVALVGNCVVAPIVLGEKFKKRDWLGIGLTIIGTITIVLSSPRNSESLSPDQLSLAIQQVGFIVYASLCALTILLLMCLSSTQWANRFIGIDVGLCAISGGFTVLSTKAFSSLLNVLFLDCFQYPITWVMLVVMLLTAILQIIFLNRALQRFDSKQVVPVQFVLFTIMAVIGSTILYGDFRDFGSAQVGNFIFACGFIFTGVYFLTREGPSREKEDKVVDPEQRKLRSTCRNTTLTPVPEESIESSSITDMVIQPPDTNRSFAMGIQGATTASIHLSHKLASPSSWKSLQFSFTSPARRTIRRQRSQPILYPRAFGTPGYYLIASSSTSRSHGTSHGFPGLV
ncbi:hypothetical protein MJO28_009606 [Puccinia striiformis f. sp. tritici]|uniref:Uncharacterized protein n=1 Tax=Puccinia striiformis f. sp. tritici TaxID=168172 RepID=A0ACC0E8D9_9BASI|nr:hypothetical protein Pst134EB_018433 [Puccinia striiformis f. sp. tritici]KAI7947698.1 hypothetical protein MJO28_009606 [Puccinia striiformis f. sp. tritici]KAI7950729.1 hypothetical protein MJO29_009403 [Puccinia striiformis f. sp. tritici]KAI9607290.1 hypothetical protein H4Q26_005807 [Puccinia striiformis f. sp. tritici PST-130]